jgi:hypothetical protein
MFTLKDSPFTAVLLLSIAFLCSAPKIHTPAAPSTVPITTEPHHKLVFENPYVRVFRVNIPPHDATLLHQHDLPYVSVSLGPADFINAVAGRPEAHVVLDDGQIGYSRGGFAHIARTDSGMVFNNVTIELLKPQGEPQNLCAKIVPGGALLAPSCPDASADQKNRNSSVPQFKTDATTVQLDSYATGAQPVAIAPRKATLLVIVDGDGIKRYVSGQLEETLSAGSVVWLGPDSKMTFSDPSGKPWSALSLSFEDAVPPSKN